jgi:hypothetical protein
MNRREFCNRIEFLRGFVRLLRGRILGSHARLLGWRVVLLLGLTRLRLLGR